MRTLDLTPLFRSTIGYDRLNSLFDTALREEAPSYPPYNIEKTGEDTYRIVIALAGFREEELEVSTHQNLLTIRGKSAPEADEGVEYLHKGIATRNFERKFSLADHVRVIGAAMANGLLSLDLVREVPEAAKPRTIAINGKPAKTLEGQAIN